MDAGRMHELACQYARARTEETLDQAFQEAMPLCALVARRFSGRGVEYDDLFQVACLACVSALKSFDAGRGIRFTTFVTPTITGTVRNFIRDRGTMLHAARGAREDHARMIAAREKYLRAHHEEPSPRELAQMLGWDLGRVMRTLTLAAAGTVQSLDQKDEMGLTLGDRLPGDETGFEKAELREDLKRAMAGLQPRERQLLALRYEQRLSQRDTAQRMNMTQMQVSRMERRLLAALQAEMEGNR